MLNFVWYHYLPFYLNLEPKTHRLRVCSCSVRHGTVVPVHAHVLHGTRVIVGSGRLLYTHHGRLLRQNGSALSSRVGGRIVTAPVRQRGESE